MERVELGGDEAMWFRSVNQQVCASSTLYLLFGRTTEPSKLTAYVVKANVAARCPHENCCAQLTTVGGDDCDASGAERSSKLVTLVSWELRPSWPFILLLS